MKLVVPILLLAAVFTWPCGPFLPELEFAPLHGPVEGSQRSFTRGQLGVIRPHFYREPLLIAYRQLSGVPFTAEEAAALDPPAGPVKGPYILHGENSPVGRWLAARRQVPGAARIDQLYPYKNLPGSDFAQFPNCLDSAFDTAVKTLHDRLTRWTNARTNLTEWLHAQDQAFENCDKGPSIPTAAPAGADPLLAADRQYQIAAAKFYAGQFDDAARDFEAIAANGNSPWRDSGRYLVARTLIRQGTLQNQPDRLRDAETKLKAILADSGQQRWHSSARGLIDFIHATLDPQGRLVGLGDEFLHPRPNTAIGQVVTDYTHLWDRLEQARGKIPVGDSEVADWIATFHGGDPRHAVDRWRAKHSAPWLLAALVWTQPKDAAAPDLLAAARALAPGSPAYPTGAYYGIRLQILRGETDGARQWADAALVTKQPDAVVNLVRSERLAVARDWSEFLRFAARKPVALQYGDGDNPYPVDADPDTPKRSAAFDQDSAGPMNRMVPLARWIDAANAAVLPRPLRADIAQAGWIRAVLLDDAQSARTLAARARELRPALAAAVRDYLAQTDPAAAQFTATFWILRMPGLAPEVRAGIGRTTKVDLIDDFRDNWWRVEWTLPIGNGRDVNHEPLYDIYPVGDIGPTGFLAPAERTDGEQQAQRLRDSVANTVNYLCAAAIAWARAHPQDTRVPEALHLAVRASRYGPADPTSSPYSREAFDLLHRRYPTSEWAQKTKYWY